ncbi:diguanylate cyclase [Yoonia rosea]|uniref:diguanylate cyclase n=1 Tax=Yoonia rosea TaxID=287098 RepID=A0A1R3XEV0_9RHOB|nr:diguanylate cyclase [Yoonia rosea]SIT89301.1 diguanylate cyclase [Yoonia rosea]
MLQLSGLLPPIIALMCLAFLFNLVLRRFHASKYEQSVFGVLFGLIVILGMTNPLSLGDGLILDTRTPLIASAVVFVGPLAGIIAVLFGLVCRIIIGGAGVAPGVMGLFLAFGIACGWKRFIGPKVKYPILNDAFLGVALTTSVLAFFLLPFQMAIQLITDFTLTLLVANVLSMVAIGLVFRRELRFVEENRKLTVHAETDALTNLLNRRGLDAAIGMRKNDAQDGHALLYFDVDNFKHVNDTYGHGAGDAALAILAARIKDSIREDALFSRHGGDEFSIYAPQLAACDVQSFADRVRTAISDQAMAYDSISFDVSISIGAFWTTTEMAIEEMIEKADAQLMLAKQAGKNRAQIAYDAPRCVRAFA